MRGGEAGTRGIGDAGPMKVLEELTHRTFSTSL